MRNFWQELPRPFFVLAPLANVTDAAFRRLIAKNSKPSGPQVMYTEFVSADGLAFATDEGRAKLLRDLLFTEAERPIVAQFFTSNPESMRSAAALALEMGFDGVDINMGCPDRVVEKQGAGAKLILNPERAQTLIRAAKEGARSDDADGIPVSVKTRLGYNKDQLEEWLPAILRAEPVVVTLHARTRKEMSKVPARWERVARAVEIRDGLGSSTLIVGNGDLASLADARERVVQSGADGAMLGRAIFGTPWLFADMEEKFFEENGLAPRSGEIRGPFRKKITPTIQDRLHIATEHTKLFEALLGDIKNFAIMKKHFKAYVEGFPGAKELRIALMDAQNAREVENLIEAFLRTEYTQGI